MELPQEWADYGARWGADGLLYLAEWRRGFTVHELRAMFFRCQQVRSLEHDLRAVTQERDELAGELQELRRRCAWYRRQLVLESRFGAMLERIAS